MQARDTFNQQLREGLPSNHVVAPERAKFENMRHSAASLVTQSQAEPALREQLLALGNNAANEYYLSNIYERVEGIGVKVPADPLQRGAEFLSHRLQTSWAGSATDSNPVSLALQMAVANKFGIEVIPSEYRDSVEQAARTAHDVDGSLRSFGLPTLFPDAPANAIVGITAEDNLRGVRAIAASPAIKAYVADTYNRTQEYLKQEGIKELTVYRGFYADRDLPAELRVMGKDVEVGLNPLSSFTTQRGVARNFAAYPTQASGIMQAPNSRVFTSTVPASRVFSVPRTALGCLGEYEVILLGGPIHTQIKNW